MKIATADFEKILVSAQVSAMSEDPIYLEKKQQLGELDHETRNLNEAIGMLMVGISQFANATIDAATSVMQAGVEDENLSKETHQTKDVFNELYNKTNNFLETEMNQNISTQISQFITEIDSIKLIGQKRDKSRLLMHNLSKKIEKLEMKNKEDFHLNEQFEYRLGKYNILNDKFVRGVNELLQKKNSLFGEIMASFQRSVQQLANESHQHLINI